MPTRINDNFAELLREHIRRATDDYDRFIEQRIFNTGFRRGEQINIPLDYVRNPIEEEPDLPDCEE